MGIKKNIIKENSYKDSVFLMQIASELEKMDIVTSASLMMGTPANKEIIKSSALLTEDGENASNNDLIIAIEAIDESSISTIIEIIEEKFSATVDFESDSAFTPPTIESALKTFKEANFALISVAGTYAAREARIALDNGLHVMIFSDNVTLENEIKLKQIAYEKDLLLMGPDCGTAIVNGVPLGFANRIPDGDIGIVAASGTGLQEVSVTIAKSGGGITQAFGTGGRDLSRDVGGLTMLKALDYLISADTTRIIVLISKPPHPEVAAKIIQQSKSTSKPVVICFLGSAAKEPEDNIIYGSTLEATGIIAARLSKDLPPDVTEFSVENFDQMIKDAKKRIAESRRYIRGLYSGGTLCDESLDILKDSLITTYSNAGKDDEHRLDDLNKSIEHTLIDMGEDEFTRGRPHPMIDLSLRNKRILQEAADPEVGVILFDLVLGYGSHPNPAGDMNDTLAKIPDDIILVASVCGTEMDPQKYSKQVEILEKNNVIVLPTNAQAARFTAALVK
ncbi:acyl-CoA synthetase FdrA [Elusimicrobiota bacterium]